MQQPNRNYTSSSYRYGFNGMEKDDELKGEGNSIDFGARIYDSRVGRWFNTDQLAKKYPDLSPYHFVANTPIQAMEVDGRDFIIIGSKEYRAKMTQLIRDMYNTSPTARRAILDIATSEKVFLIVENEQMAIAKGGNFYKGGNSSKAEGYLIFSFKLATETLGPENGANGGELEQTISSNFGHELGHMFDDLKGILHSLPHVYEYRGENKNRVSLKSSEVSAVKFENIIRSEEGLKLRTHYKGFDVFDKIAVDATPTSQYTQSILVKENYDFMKHTPIKTLQKNLDEVFKSNNWWDVKFEVTKEKREHSRFGFPSHAVPNAKPKEEYTRIKLKEKKEDKE